MSKNCRFLTDFILFFILIQYRFPENWRCSLPQCALGCTPAKTVDMTRKIINANDRLQDSLQSLVSTLHDANDDYLHRKIFLWPLSSAWHTDTNYSKLFSYSKFLKVQKCFGLKLISYWFQNGLEWVQDCQKLVQ